MRNNQLIQARKEKGLTQEDLAKILGCKKSTVSNWENGYSTPTLVDAFKLSYLFDKDISVLFAGIKVQVFHTISN